MSLPNLSQASESLQSILAARQAQPKPDFSYTCNNCHEEVPWKRCKSNDNGNEGRWMAVVSLWSVICRHAVDSFLGYSVENSLANRRVRFSDGHRDPKVYLVHPR
jgi:hypothetical protein